MKKRTVPFFVSVSKSRAALAVFVVLSLAIVALSLAYFAASATKPYMAVTLSLSDGRWVVQDADPNGVGSQVGIRPGDVPVEINGQAAATFLTRYASVGEVTGPLIHQISVVDLTGRVISVNLVGAHQATESSVELIGLFLVSLSFWLTGFYVFFKRSASLPAFLLCVSGLALGLALGSNMASARAIPGAVFFEVCATVLGPWILLHFFLVLPEERALLAKNPLVLLIYSPAVVTLVFFPLVGYANGQPLPGFRTIRYFEYGAGFLAAAAVALLNYVRAASPRTRQQMKIVLVGCLAALLPILGLNILPQAMWQQPIIAPGFSFVFIAFIPVGLGYAVVTQKLMDIRVVVRRTIVYGLVTAAMAAVLSAAILAVQAFRLSISLPHQILLAIALGITATILANPAKNNIEILVDKLLYKDRYDYRQIIQNTSNSLRLVRETSDVSRLTVGASVQALNLDGGALFAYGQGGQLETGALQGTFASDEERAKLLARLALRQRGVQAEFPNAVSDTDGDLAFVVPLVFGNKEIGVLCLSQKASKQAFSADDIFLIQGVASVTAIALASAMLIRDVSARDTFVSVASHELRTPLTAVLGYAELLAKDESSETHRRWINAILTAGRRMSRMVDDLLNVTRVQTGMLRMRIEKVMIAELLQDRLNFAREGSNDHEFLLTTEPNLMDGFVDREKFGQVIWNLLSNAIKYSPQGGRITVSARNDGERRSVIVSVADEGIGIGPSDRESLFKTFHRIQRPETEGIEGSGLGLYIVKEWTEAMGGRVWLESELNVGSTFFVAIPAANS